MSAIHFKTTCSSMMVWEQRPRVEAHYLGPPHTHTYIRSIIRHIFTYLQASLYFLGGWANITFPYGLWDVGS